MSNELVSVVIPVYNVQDYIRNTLESVINQTYKNIELVLVNDGTPDESVKVAEDFLKDKKVSWKIIHQENQGLSAARNRGILEASGQWIICPDSDDYIVPQTIERMLDAANAFSSKCVFCGYKNVDDANVKADVKKEGTVISYDSKEMRNMFLTRKYKLLVPGMLLHKSIYKDIAFDTNCPYDEDIHFIWRLLFKIDKVVYIDSDFYNYLTRYTSMVHTLKPEAYLKTSKAYDKMVEQLRKVYPEEKVLIDCIYPKYRLGGLHVLAKSTNYRAFKDTVMKDGYRREMTKLILQKNIKLSILALIYCMSLRSFYEICKRG